jgi:hypothetical protein
MYRHTFGRTSTVAFLPALLVILAGCGAATAVSPPAGSVGPCPVTLYVSGRPPDRNTASFTTTWFGNDALWAGLDRSYGGLWLVTPPGTTSLGQPDEGLKVLWYRGIPGQLAIDGQRLDGPSTGFHALVLNGYGQAGLQVSAIAIPTAGCWRITGRVGGTGLTFVVRARVGGMPSGSTVTEPSPSGPVAAGLTISGAISTRITWYTDFLPNCYATTVGGTQAFFFGVLGPNTYQVYVSINGFHGPGMYDATTRPAIIGHFDWRQSAVTVFNLSNDEAERWFANAGTFTVDTVSDTRGAGSLDVDLQPGGSAAGGPIHITGSWTCSHSGN